jgi:NodT family efflux transporter outer membrane factor (OMF) lipoprotein
VGGGHFAWAKYGYASFNWGLDLWGGRRDAWEAAVGQSRAAAVDAQAARLELSANVARAYAQLGYAYARQDVANAEAERARSARKLTLQRVAAGLDSKLQSKQADAEVADAEQSQAVAARAIDASRSSLAVLLGTGPDRALDIARPHLLQPAAVAVPAQLPLELIGHRPDLVAARWRVEAAYRDIGAAKAQFMPNVSIGALAGLIAMGGANLFQAPARFYQFGPSLSLPIFDGGRLRANLSGKDAEYDIAAAQYNQTLVGAVNQVADDVNANQSMQVQIDAQQRSLDAARQAWDLAQQRYQAGVGSYLEALGVRQQLLLAEQRMAALKAQQIDLSVQLIEALGGGYRPDGTRPGDTSASDASASPRAGQGVAPGTVSTSPSHS